MEHLNYKTVITVDVDSADAKMARLLKAYEEFKSAARDIEPGFLGEAIKIEIKK